MLINKFCIAAVVLGAMSSAAYSQPPADQTVAPTQVPVYPQYPPDPTPPPAETMFDRLGLSISAGGGVSGFTDSELRGTTSDGGGWNVRATFGTRSLLSLEAQYLGSAQAVDALGLDSDAMLVSNGVQGNLRFNFLRERAVQPFLFAGVAWRRYDITNTARNLSDISDQDDVVEVPAGAGVAFRWRGFLLDARGELRAATYEDLMPRFDIGGIRDKAPMHRYGVNASIGYEF